MENEDDFIYDDLLILPEDIYNEFEMTSLKLNEELVECWKVITIPFALAEVVAKEGISRADVLQFNGLGVQVSNNLTPLESFTEERSRAQKVLAGESIVKGVFNVVTAPLKLIAAIIGGIFKLIGKFLSWITGGPSSVPVYSGGSAAIDAANIPTNTETINGSASILKFLPREKQRAFWRAAVAVRTKVGMSLTVMLDDIDRGSFTSNSKYLKDAAKESSKRLEYVDIAIKGLDKVEETLNTMTTVEDFYSLEDITIETNNNLVKAAYGIGGVEFEKVVKVERTKMAVVAKKMENKITSEPITNADYAGLAQSLPDMHSFGEHIANLRTSSKIKGWDAAIKRATMFASKVDHIESKIDGLKGMDTLSPRDLETCKEVLGYVKVCVNNLSAIITTNLNIFGRVIQHSRIPKGVVDTIENLGKMIAENTLNDKTFEIAINADGEYFKK